MTGQNVLQLIVLPILYLIVRDMLAFKREVYTDYVRKDDCIRYKGQKDSDIVRLHKICNDNNKLLNTHIGFHKGKESKNGTG